MPELTLKQEKFVHHYVETGNATQSALKANYSPRTARQMASENLSKPVIREAIQEKTSKIYDPEMLKRKLTEVIENPDNQTILTRAIELGMRSEAMLTDRSINENYNQDIGRDAMSRAAEDALKSMTKPLVRAEDDCTEPNANKVEHDKG